MSLTREQLEEYFSFQHNVPSDVLDRNEPLFSSRILDSFVVIDVLLFLEGRLNVQFNPADVSMERLDTIPSILSLATEYLSKTAN